MDRDPDQAALVRRVRPLTVYKLLFLGLIFSLVPLGVIFGIAAMFGANTITVNNEHWHGASALIAGPLIGCFASLMFTAIAGTAVNIGLWLFSLVSPLVIRFIWIPPEEQAQPVAQADRPASGGSSA